MGNPQGQEAVGATWVQEPIPAVRKSKAVQGPGLGAPAPDQDAGVSFPRSRDWGLWSPQRPLGEAASERAPPSQHSL